MNTDEHHVALPKLYGAPAYARPPRPVESVERPVDPDDLPLEAFRELEELMAAPRDLAGPGDLAAGRSDPPASMLLGGGDAASPSDDDPGDGEPALHPRPFSIRNLGRLISGR